MPVYSYSPIYKLIEQYEDEGKSWKYTSVLVNPGQKKYIGSTVDGDGEEIKIYKRVIVCIIGAIVLLLQTFGIKVDAPYVNELVEAICAVLVVLGIVKASEDKDTKTQQKQENKSIIEDNNDDKEQE